MPMEMGPSLYDRQVSRPCALGLPLVGSLFTRRQDDLDQKNLLIFLTPKIINNQNASHRLSIFRARAQSA